MREARHQSVVGIARKNQKTVPQVRQTLRRAARACVEALEPRQLLSADATEFASPITGLGLKGITVGADGNFYFAEPGTGLNPGRIGSFNPQTDQFLQFSIPTATNRPQSITAGPDGNIWFTESPGGKVASMTPAGVITEYTVPTANSQPQQIISASDGNLWFTEFSSTPSPGTSKIAKITPTGTFTEYSTLFAPPPPDNPLGLVDRGDGNIWYVANGSSRVGFQGETSGVAGETSIPTANSGPFGIAEAADNNLYYTESATDKIGRITNLFTAQSEISLTTGSEPESIVAAPDGYLYFTEFGTGRVAQLDPSTFTVTHEFLAGVNSQPTGIVIGPDGNPWVTENGLDRIARINVHPDPENFIAKMAPNPSAGKEFSGEVAEFTSSIATSAASDFAVNIDWGDGTLPTPGTIVKGAAGKFFVSGDHTYSDASGSPYTMTVTVSRALGDYPVNATAQVTVNGPGGGAAPAISIANVTQNEGNAGTTAFNFTVTRTGDLSGPSSVAYATSDGSATTVDGDYQPISNTLAFNPGEASKTITVLVNGDTKFESNETFLVTLSSPAGATLSTAQAIGTIVNDDAQSVYSIDASVMQNEGNSGTTPFAFTVTRTGNTTGAATIPFATADVTATSSGPGADYTAASGTLQFNPGDSSATITVLVNGDLQLENDETFTVNLSAPSDGGTVNNAVGTGTILNDDHAPVANNDTYTTTKNAALTVHSPGLLANDTDADGNKLTASGVVNNPANGAVVLNPDGSFTYTPNNGYVGPDSFTYQATDGANLSNSATVTINVQAPALPKLSINNVSLTEGNSGTKNFVFTVMRTGDTSGASTVHYATANGTATAGSDYNAAAGTLSFSPGQTSKTITVQVKGDTAVEGNETFKVNLSSATGATIQTASGTGTIQNDDTPPPLPKLSIGGFTANEGNSGTTAFTFKVTLDKSSTQPVTVHYATSNGTAVSGSDYNAASGALTFSPGQTVLTITVLVKGDTTKESDENFFVTLSAPVNATISVAKATGLIKNDD